MTARNLGFVTKTIRTVFICIFFILVIHGIFSENSDSEYVFRSNDVPVISFTVDALDINTQASGDSIYVLGNGDVFPGVSAQAAAVISADTGEALFLKNADSVLPMASTTKIMTAIVAMEKLSPDMVVTIPPEACGIEGSSIYLVPGEKLTVSDLMYGLLLESGNDAACALAILSCGSIESFVTEMNVKASELGLAYTHFDNPHGLSSENHRTTARELATITYHAMKLPLFREIAGTKNYTVTDEQGVPTKYFSNHNRMLKTYIGATGVKTGYTIASGRCLVTSAMRDGTEFIVVTLNDRNDFRDHAVLLDFAFEKYKTRIIAEAGEVYGTFGGRRLENEERIAVVTEKNSQITCQSSRLE